MSQRIAFVAATEKEIEPLVAYLRTHAEQHSFQTFQLHGLSIDLIYTGIGILHTTYSLMDYLSHRHPDGWIQAGVGGAFDPDIKIGDVFLINSERMLGIGAEDQDGRIMDPFELGWNDPDAFPYLNGLLVSPYKTVHTVATATGMTTFFAHGQQVNIDLLRKYPHGQIENMEGAPFFFISLIKRIPFLSLRSVSNPVEARDKSKWNMELAIENLNHEIIRILEESKLNKDKLFRLIPT